MRTFVGVTVASLLTTLAAGPVGASPGNPGGLSWSPSRLTAIPYSPSRDAQFSSVACPSATSCLVVGEDPSGSETADSVVEHFDGRSWHRLRVGLRSDEIDGVACAGPSYCVVVGSTSHGRPLAEVDRRGRWIRLVDRQASGTVTSVACPHAGWCVTMGSASGWDPPPRSWVLSGSTWRAVPVHVSLKANIDLDDVSCVDSGDCEAVGGYNFGGPAGAGLALHFDGSAWTADEVQNWNVYRGFIDEVSCTTRGLCVSVEDLSWPIGRDENGQMGIFVQQRSRGRWRALGRGLPTAQQLGVADGGVQCFATGTCWVIGGGSRYVYLGTVDHGRLSPLSILRRIRLHGDYPWLTSLACASPALCVEVGDGREGPYVLIGRRST